MENLMSEFEFYGPDGPSDYFYSIAFLNRWADLEFTLYDRGEKEPTNKCWHVSKKLDVKFLREMFSSYRCCNVGVRLGGRSMVGARYLVGIDFNVVDPAKSHEAHAWMQSHCPEYLKLPSVICGSGSESRHFYGTFTNCPTRTNLAKGDGWSIDVCGDVDDNSCQNMWPGSLHPDRGLYTFERKFDYGQIWPTAGAKKGFRGACLPTGLEFSSEFEALVFQKIAGERVNLIDLLVMESISAI